MQRFFFLLPVAAFSLSVLAAPKAPPVKAPIKTSVKAPVAEPLPALANWNYQLLQGDLEAAWSWRAGVEASGPFETRVALHYRGPQDYLLLRVVSDGRAARLGFWRVAGGKVFKIGTPEGAVLTPSGRLAGQLTVQRSAWRVRALWNGRAVVTAFSDLAGAKLGTAARGAVKLEAPDETQPVEPVLLRDDFMRAQGPNEVETSGAWRRLTGTWKTSGRLGAKVSDALNPNPFVFRAEAPADAASGTLAAATGKWAWSDYTVTVSLRPTLKKPGAPLVAGVCAYRQADGASVAGAVNFGTGRATLSSGGTVLATSAPFNAAPDQWHRLFLDPGPGALRLIVDGVERVRWPQPAAARAANSVLSPQSSVLNLAQGEAALQATVGGGNYIDFDDVRIDPNEAISDDFHVAAIGRWEDAGGEWQTQAGARRRVKITPGPALSLTGSAEREEGRIEATFDRAQGPRPGSGLNAPTSPLVGVVFAVRDERNYFLVRDTGADLEIVEYANGLPKSLARAHWRRIYTATLNMKPVPELTVEWGDGVITARAANAIVTATVSGIPAGRVGVWADGPGGVAAVTSFHALGAAPGWGETALPEKFQKDRLMQYWASNAAAWKAANAGGGAGGGNDITRWHTGDFFTDAAVELPLPTLAANANLTLTLGGDPAQPGAGGQLAVERGADGLTLKLAESGQAIKTATVPLLAGAETRRLRFVRQPLGAGKVLLRVAVNGQAVLSETTQSSVLSSQSYKAGVRLLNVPNFNWENVVATTRHKLDYAFTNAPVDWESTAGRWEVAERWTCQPQFGFFAGTGAVNPALWSRFAVRGDFTLEAYVATPMDLTRGERGPADINLNVGGDGRDLAGGYSFLFAARDKSVNWILRGDEVAFEGPYTLPPGQGNSHQDFFYVRLERRRTPQGLRFRYSVNGREIADYTDPNPLPGAFDQPQRLAFWTLNGGLSLARVRLWYSGLDSGVPAPDNRATGVLTAQGETPQGEAPERNALGEWGARAEGVAGASARLQTVSADGRRALQIVNPQSGGDWTTYVTRQPFDATQHPVLRFDYRVPENVFINLYAKIEGRWHQIIFTGDATRLRARMKRNVARPAPGLRPKKTGPAIVPSGAAKAEPDVPDDGQTLGRIAGVQLDGQWHTATFDLLAALRARDLGTHIQALTLAAPDLDYLHAGLGGNRCGATYWLADLQAPPRPAVAAVP